jgi:hypothetical protein
MSTSTSPVQNPAPLSLPKIAKSEHAGESSAQSPGFWQTSKSADVDVMYFSACSLSTLS